MAKIQELSLFSGAGAFEKGLQRVDPSIETVAYCEIDPHAGKYYLSKEQIDQLVFKPNFEKLMRGEIGIVQDEMKNAFTGDGGISGTLRVAGDKPTINEQVVMGNVNPSGRGQGGDVHTGDIAPTLTTNKGEGEGVKVAYPKEQPLQLVNATKAGHLPAQDGDGVVLNFLTSARGRVQEQTSPTLTTADMAGVVEGRPIINSGKPEVYQNGRRMKQNDEPAFTITTVDRHGVVLIGGTQYAIRKLTPLECWRLMDFDDSDFLAARLMGISDTQLYKIAGNSIVVSVTEAIARKLHPIILRSYEKE